MIEWLDQIDQKLFLALNGFHFDWLDPIMYTLSGKLIWIPLYLFLLFILFKYYKMKGLYFLLIIGLTIFLADQTTSGFMKPFFERPRPSHHPNLESLVHIVNDYRGGSYGFASSHAANTFAIAMLFTLILPFKRIKLLFLWAAIVSYTRIYLGVHFPGDIIVGAIIGIISGFLSYKLGILLLGKKLMLDEPNLNPNL